MFTFLITFVDGTTHTVRVNSRSAAHVAAHATRRSYVSVVEITPDGELFA